MRLGADVIVFSRCCGKDGKRFLSVPNCLVFFLFYHVFLLRLVVVVFFSLSAKKKRRRKVSNLLVVRLRNYSLLVGFSAFISIHFGMEGVWL